VLVSGGEKQDRGLGVGHHELRVFGSVSATPETLISAILFLTRQKWRTSINRAAEAMTLFAVICAGIFPGIHGGSRSGWAWFLAPIPNSYGIWAETFRSPLLWGRVRGLKPTSRCPCSSGTRA